jgi:hypothetical protein
MKRNWLIVLAVVLSGIWGLQEGGAATAGYEDSVSNGVTGVGVVGARYTGAAGFAVYGEITNSTGAGVQGNASADTGITYGVWGKSYSSTGTGVYGTAWAKNGTTYGVYGVSASTSGTGVYGIAAATSGITYGVYGQSDSPTGRGLYGYTSAKTGASHGVYGLSMSTSGRGVYGYAKATSGKAIGVYGQTKSPTGYGVYSKGNMHVAGNFTASGSKSAVVGLGHGEGVTLYAVEAAENWFEDAGSARLENGRAVVHIDPIFARTVDTKLEYQVFLTPKEDCKGLYATNQGESSFEVRELNGGSANIPFAFRVMAKRKGYADQRLARVSTEQMMALASPVTESGPVPEDQ